MRTPHGFNEADALTAQVVQAELALREIDGDLAAVLKPLATAIAAAKSQSAKARKPHLELIRSALPALAQWHRLNLIRYGRGRSITLPSGNLEAHITGQWRVTVTGDLAKIIPIVADRNPAGIKVDVSLDLTEIGANPEVYAGIDGLEITMSDILRVTSDLLDPAKAPKESRLSALYHRYLNPLRKPRPQRTSRF